MRHNCIFSNTLLGNTIEQYKENASILLNLMDIKGSPSFVLLDKLALPAASIFIISTMAQVMHLNSMNAERKFVFIHHKLAMLLNGPIKCFSQVIKSRNTLNINLK